MEIVINEPVTEAKEIPFSEFNVKMINSIQTLYKKERQESKPASFALT